MHRWYSKSGIAESGARGFLLDAGGKFVPVATQADITQRDRDAVTLAVYECLLGASAEMAMQAEELQTEACWRGPDAEAWMKWRIKRRHFEGSRREPDPTT